MLSNGLVVTILLVVSDNLAMKFKRNCQCINRMSTCFMGEEDYGKGVQSLTYHESIKQEFIVNFIVRRYRL